jgi:hypothetical protein
MLAGFDSIIANGVGNINVHPAASYRVVVTTDNNIQDIIVIEVENNILNIENRGNFKSTELTIDVYMPELKAITLKGIGDIRISNGNAADLKMDLSGHGSIDAQNYEVEDVEIIISGVGTISTMVTNSLSVEISGVGNVLYGGNPLLRSINITGTGRFGKL